MGSKQPEGIKKSPGCFFISAPIFSSIKSRIPCAVGVAIRCEQNRGEFTTSTLLLLDFRLTGKPEKVVTNYHFPLRKPVLKSLEKGDFLFCCVLARCSAFDVTQSLYGREGYNLALRHRVQISAPCTPALRPLPFLSLILGNRLQATF